jgi:hypothetical protein
MSPFELSLPYRTALTEGKASSVETLNLNKSLVRDDAVEGIVHGTRDEPLQVVFVVISLEVPIET